METLEAFHYVLKGLGGWTSELVKYYLEIITGLVGLLFVSMKAYAFGRDRLLRKVQLFMLGDEGFWDRKPRTNMGKHIRTLRDSVPVIMVANYKGGVAKSTVVANLGAYFDSIGIRVLLIDFDYQGTLTDAVINTDGKLKFGAVDLIEPMKSAAEVLEKSEQPLPHYKRSRIFASSYTFSRTENRVVFRWLVGEDTDDVRYRLHGFLSSDVVQSRFDLVLIDCPPRLMTATANAVCASTHVLVPTILDDLSTSAAINTIASIRKLRDTLSPTLRILGVVPTFVQMKTKFNRRELEALDFLKTELKERFESSDEKSIILFEQQRILRKEAIAVAAGQTVPYFENSEIRSMFTELGMAIAKELGGTIAEAANAGEGTDRGVGASDDSLVVLRR